MWTVLNTVWIHAAYAVIAILQAAYGLHAIFASELYGPMYFSTAMTVKSFAGSAAIVAYGLDTAPYGYTTEDWSTGAFGCSHFWLVSCTKLVIYDALPYSYVAIGAEVGSTAVTQVGITDNDTGNSTEDGIFGRSFDTGVVYWRDVSTSCVGKCLVARMTVPKALERVEATLNLQGNRLSKRTRQGSASEASEENYKGMLAQSEANVWRQRVSFKSDYVSEIVVAAAVSVDTQATYTHGTSSIEAVRVYADKTTYELFFTLEANSVSVNAMFGSVKAGSMDIPAAYSFADLGPSRSCLTLTCDTIADACARIFSDALSLYACVHPEIFQLTLIAQKTVYTVWQQQLTIEPCVLACSESDKSFMPRCRAPQHWLC